jgi:uncharacterized protein
MPPVSYFAPSWADGEPEVNVLKLEELEALRLKDLEGLEQQECADRMEGSRPTFQRILLSARQKTADSLCGGKAIRIEGGNFTRNICPVTCLDCGNRWNESYEHMQSAGGNFTCPKCSSRHLACSRVERGAFCHGHCRRHGRGPDGGHE